MKTRWIYTFPLLVLLLLAQNNRIEAGSERYRSFDFYGHRYGVFYHPVMDDISVSDLRPHMLLNQIERIRQNHLSILTDHIRTSSIQYQLDELGTLILIKKMVHDWLPHKGKNERSLMQYVILHELGYDVLLTRTGTQLNVLGRLDFVPRKYVYVNYRGLRYIHLDFEKAQQGKQHEVIQDRKKGTALIRYRKDRIPLIYARKDSKNFQMIWQNDTLEFPVTLNQSLISYYYDVPLMPLGTLHILNSLSPQLKETLYPALRQQLTGKTRADQLRFLLAFVQQIVPYGSDLDKYGMDYYYFPEQTLMATTADCEDKAFLLAALSRDLLGIQSVGLHFKQDQHLAIAFELPGFFGGQTFTYRGKQYIPCEPTSTTPVLAYSAFDLSRLGGIVELM